jgi:hypothetical protein
VYCAQFICFQPTLEDYEEVPVESFGMRMLLQMGYNEETGIGNRGYVNSLFKISFISFVVIFDIKGNAYFHIYIKKIYSVCCSVLCISL